MQTKNINHQHDPQGLVHQNCHLTNGTTNDTHALGALPNDRLYGSTGALYQRPDLTNVNLNANVRNKSMITSPPKMLTPLRCGPTNNYRSSIHSHNHQLPTANSCTSTPVLSGSSHLLRRQTSLGHLDDHSMAKSSQAQGSQNSDRRFGSFQQRIRAMLSPSKDCSKAGSNSTNSMNSNEASTSSQCSNYNDWPQTNETIQTANTSSHRTQNQYPTIGSSIMNSQSLGSFNSIEDENDSFHLRDVCSKWFGQKQSQSLSSTMASAVNKSTDSPKLSHNMKTTLYDKVVAKDSICQNPNNSSNDDNQVLHTQTLRQQNSSQPNYVDVPHLSSDNSVQTPNDQHVVVVSCLESDATRDNTLTVRPEMPSNELMTESNAMPSSSYHSIGVSASAIAKMNELQECVDSTGSQDNNYKSSSESGRGTMRSNLDGAVKHDSHDGVSPLDLTSLDSDQSTHGLTTSVWVKQNLNQDSCLEPVSSNETIEKMQRELQRILEDNSVQSSEVEVDDLSKSFQTRLSVVNESDSWTSNTPPQSPQTGTLTKFSESKIESKCSKISSNGMNTGKHNTNSLKNTSCKAINSSKQKCSTSEKQVIPINKQNVSNEKNKYSTQRSSKYQVSSSASCKRAINDRSYYNLPNKGKLRLPQPQLKSKDRFINLVDCDMVSTTTARDSNYPDDLSSEYTANTSFCDRDEVFSIRKQLQGLENMYSEIVGMLGSRLKTDSGHRTRRKVCRSISSVTGRSSVTSRGTRDLFYRRSKHEHRKHRTDDTHSSRRLKRLESHVVTLARSVAQLSSDMRYNHSLSQELENLRQDIDLIKDQLLALKHSLSNGLGMSSKSYHQSNGHISANGRRNVIHLISPNRVEKLTRFFGDEPPLLRQFLKKLGYEKYARNFESEKIGINELPYLSEERIQKLGIPMGPRMRIMQEAQSTLKSTSNDQFSIYGLI